MAIIKKFKGLKGNYVLIGTEVVYDDFGYPKELQCFEHETWGEEVPLVWCNENYEPIEAFEGMELLEIIDYMSERLWWDR